jgi:type II secretory pathway pseudopilin PulG
MRKVCFWLRHRGFDSRVCADSACGADGEQGFMLVGLIVAIFLILLVLSIAAPKVSKELQREREVEAVHRGNQYVRAIQVYVRKNGSQFPPTIEALEKSNNQRFLRQRYVDPMTGKSDWRLIHVGEAKTTVKGFFGKPLTGLAPGLGSAAGMASSGGIGAGAAGSSSPSAFGSPGTSAYGSSSSGSSAFGSSSPGSSAFGSSSPGTSGLGSTNSPTTGSTATGSTATTGGATTGTDTSGSTTSGSTPSGSSPGIASQSATSFSGGGAPFVGVGIPKEGTSIIVLNEQTSYNTWEFIYDPRIEQLKAQASLFGGGPSTASGTGGLGSASSMTSGTGTNGTGTGFGSTPSSGFGTTPSSGFGSTPSSGFGSSPTSGTGTSSPTTPTTPQQQQ